MRAGSLTAAVAGVVGLACRVGCACILNRGYSTEVWRQPGSGSCPHPRKTASVVHVTLGKRNAQRGGWAGRL